MLRVLLRLLPVVLLLLTAAVWFNDVQDSGPCVPRNLLPLAIVVLLSALTLWQGKGSWKAGSWQLALGTLGFAIPALGLAAYLHYAYDVNLDGMFNGAQEPLQLFRFLPYYTVLAGGIGFALGWVVGRKL